MFDALYFESHSGLHFRLDPVDVMADVCVYSGHLDSTDRGAVRHDPGEEYGVALLARFRPRE